jgi:hypothetical protein
MSQETTFKISDWIGKDIAMSAAPPRVHRMAKEEFILPQQFDLLPSDMLSLPEMVDFSVPLESPPSSAVSLLSISAQQHLTPSTRMPYIVCTVFPFRKPKSSVSDAEEAFNEINVYDDCDISLNVVFGLMVSGTSSVAADLL